MVDGFFTALKAYAQVLQVGTVGGQGLEGAIIYPKQSADTTYFSKAVVIAAVLDLLGLVAQYAN